MMDLFKLFPNSIENRVKKLHEVIPLLTLEQKECLDVVSDYALAHQRQESPVRVYVVEPDDPFDSSSVAYHKVFVARGEHRELVHITLVPDEAQFKMRVWKHLLLGHDMPNPDNFNFDPKRKCSECGAMQSIHSERTKCKCVPF